MIVKAPAKINICLDIVGKRQDGYHLLHTVMHEIPVYDIVTVEKSDEITVKCKGMNNEQNIAYKAATAFFDYTKIQGGAKIDIEKHIPKEAGLGGGSSDAASVIKALNDIYKTNLSDNEMCEIAVTVGADVPFFIIGGCCEANGIGEILTPVKKLPPCYTVVVKPKFSVSTKEAFEIIDSCTPNPHTDTCEIVNALNKGDLRFIAENMFNVMETNEDITKIKEQMISYGALGAVMSGSGSSVFALFDNYELAKNCKNNLEKNMEFAELF